MKPSLTKVLRAAIVLVALTAASVAAPHAAEARSTGCSTETPGTKYIWLHVCDDQGGRIITYDITNPDFASRCVRVSWWNAGRRIQLHPANGWLTVPARTNSAGPPKRAAAYTVFADATIEIVDCRTLQKVVTYKIGAWTNPNGFI